jgi:hypothetical protein
LQYPRDADTGLSTPAFTSTTEAENTEQTKKKGKRKKDRWKKNKAVNKRKKKEMHKSKSVKAEVLI